MKFSNMTVNKREGSSVRKQGTAEATVFHTIRMQREKVIEVKKESAQTPQGTDEYEQLIAEDASFNTKPMIEEAAFFLSEKRGFARGNEISDWLQAEVDVESLLRGTVIDRRTISTKDRREAAAPEEIITGQDK